METKAKIQILLNGQTNQNFTFAITQYQNDFWERNEVTEFNLVLEKDKIYLNGDVNQCCQDENQIKILVDFLFLTNGATANTKMEDYIK